MVFFHDGEGTHLVKTVAEIPQSNTRDKYPVDFADLKIVYFAKYIILASREKQLFLGIVSEKSPYILNIGRTCRADMKATMQFFQFHNPFLKPSARCKI